MKKLLGIKKGIIALSLISIVFNMPSYAFGLTEKREKKLPKNVYLDGIDLSGKTLKEVEALIDDKVYKMENKNIKIDFTYDEESQNKTFKLKDLGYYSNKDRIMKEISFILYNDLNPIDQIKNYIDIRKNGRKYAIIHSIDYDVFTKSIDKFDTSMLPKPTNAKYEYKNGRVIIIPETNGYELDKKKLYDELYSRITENENQFILYCKIWKPDITKAVLQKQGIKEKIASFTTVFNSNNKSRSNNIRLAAKIINGTVIAPGEIFSFNKTVGERTRARGFSEAGVYINGNLDTGLGGGICQVSSTLYNAVLLADLEVLERNNHSLTVNYVPLSRDAAVSWGSKDLKFRNNKDFYIFIHSSSVGNTVTFDIFGTKGNRKVELTSEIIESKESPIKYIKDPSLGTGDTVIVKRGHKGYRSRLIKKVYENGKLIKVENVSDDRYLTTPTIVRLGV